MWYHSAPMDMVPKVLEPQTSCWTDTVANGPSEAKPKRKKLKGKRAVVRWLKSFRYKKKKDYERMTAEEKILFKLRKAQRKEKQLLEALNKIEPKESSETTHDPEILTPEEHFYFLKMGKKSKNYVPIGRRGIYQGVILNMHLHWKKHETLQVRIKTFTPDEVKDMAVELARLSGGIVLDIDNDDTIIMYRGKNYSQPPTEIMSPRVTLPRKKALDKSKYKDALRAVRRYIPRLEQDLELLRAKAGNGPGVYLETELSDTEVVEPEEYSKIQLEAKEKLEQVIAKNDTFQDDDDYVTGPELVSDSEDLSDIFETDRETDEDNDEKPLYLNEFDKFCVESNEAEDDFEEHLRRISANSKKEKELEFDEVDRVVLRAASLIKKRR
ncbi:putative CRM domain-containing protein At3g25440, chloroplastic [Bidens hawaiensis]|uniref:putative CRM domain-containing protein At3g25440, chloroplastic n=1 Tax=Bidens hawaiensis TaxID=980011 RepID=UPI004049ECF7